MQFTRQIQAQIEERLFKGKAIVLYGARRVGKTTLCQQILEKYKGKSRYINCELLTNKLALETTNHESLRSVLGDYQLVVLDEAQTIKNIGNILKILVDTFPEIQIVATGSSSFDLANQVKEPLTGRARQFLLYPFSLQEIHQYFDKLQIEAKLENILRYGLYPSVFDQSGEEAREELQDIASKYLYKDILECEGLKRPDLILNLLKALALQIGKEVSYQELAKLLQENHHTIARYIELLEKCFIIFRLPSFSRNLRKELGKKQKIFFYDLGIRNMLIQNFNQVNPVNREDVGGLWENFCILERIKNHQNQRKFLNTYFWRTYNQKEIDYLEESDGELKGFEFKWNPEARHKVPTEFLETYTHSSFEVISRDNYMQFLTFQ